MPNVLLNFEDLHAGDIVNGQFSGDGVTISSANAHTPPMVFDTENPTGGDHDLETNNLGNVLILSEDGDSSDPDDNAGGGTFVFEFDEPSEVINFRALDVEEGGEVRLYNEAGHLIKTVHIPHTANNGQVTVNINADDVARMEIEICGSGAIDEICYCTPEPVSELDGIVEGSAGNDLIDAAYDGDPDGDCIDANDEILPGEGPNDDIVDAFGGDDTILSGEGNDEVYAGSGDDTVDGGAGDDIIYGDSNYSGPGAGGTVRESFEWDLQSENEVDTSFVQDTGNVDVTFTRLADVNHHDSYLNNEQLNVDGIDGGSETVDTDSGLTSITNGADGRGEFQWEFSTPVTDVDFNINDIDGDGVVNVTAYDANGNEIPVTLTGGSHLTLIDTDGVNGADTADSNGGYDNTDSDNYNLQVQIAGPVARIVVNHTQDGGNNSGIRITDMFYDTNTSVVDNGPDGNDTLRGGDGNDTIFGEGGNDRLEGGAGDDELNGGDGNDIIIGGSGNDVANGGDGNEEIWMGSGDDIVNGGNGNDWIHGQNGNDTLNGDAGDDMLFGEGGDDVLNGGSGNDMLTGGSGADVISGGDDRDMIKGGNDGDVVDGGAGGDDFDTLDLTGEGPFRVVNETEDADGNSTSGTVEFLDNNGNVTGSLQFTEIEQILGDRVNQGPDANDDNASVDEDDSVTIDVLGNDTDPEDDDLTVIDATSPDGEVTVNADGTITFTPAPNFNGDTTITYTIEDEAGNTDTATVNVHVAPINDDPVANDDTAETDEDTPVTIDVLGNDTDVDGDDLTVSEATSPNGDVTINPDGTITFTPDENFNGETTITYTVSDGAGGEDTATVTVSVAAVDELTAVDDEVTTDEDTPITIDAVANDLNEDGGVPTIIDASVPADQGTVAIVGNELVFTPAENFNGEATITYTIEDEDGLQDTAEVAVTVTPVNDAPDAVNDTDTTDEDTPITLDVLDNDTDLDGDALTVTGATVPADQGTVEIVGNQVVFTPAENFNGLATISYSISDGNGGTDTAIHEVDVLPVNDAPVAVDDIAQTEEDTAVVIDLIANDTDVDGDDLTIGTVSVPPEQGTVVDNGDGTVTFTPAPNYTGPAQITYTVVDGNGGEDMGGAVVNVFIEGVNDGPDAVDDAVTTDEDTPVTIDALANDTDLEGDDLTITGASVPADQGTVEVVGNELVFTPAPDFNGEATITYSITDGNGGTDTAEVAVTVTPVNDDPVAVDDNATTDEDEPITLDLIANDTDVDGDDLTIGSVSVPADQGTVVDNGDGTVTFTPAPNFNGPATITYTVIDGNGGEDEGEAVVSVGAVNDGPDAVDDADTTDEDTPITVDLLANDTDDDGDDLTVINATVPADQGTLVDNGDGTVTFTPAPDFNGEATITYEISDGNGGTDIAEHVITVTAVEDTPEAEDDTAETDEDTPVTIDVLANDSDPDGDPLTVSEATSPDGDVTINPDGTITFTPDENFNGPTTITYTVTDPDGNEDTATVDVSVTPVNDAPDAVNDTDTTDEDTPITLDVLDNDTDVDGDTLIVTGATVPAEQGTVQVINNEVVFTPAENFNGLATISYSITDGNGGTDTAIHEVNVTPVNDDPVAVDDAADTMEDEPVTFDLIGNDTDVDGDDLTIGSVSVPADQGTVVDNGDGTVTFTPAPDFNGPATITYTVIDGQGGEDEGQAIVNVGSVNDGPIAEDDSDTTDEDTPITVDLLANDSDPEGDDLTVTGASVPADQGTLVDNGDGTVTFTPAPDFNGTATISYTITDGNGGTASAEHVIEVTPVNDDPVAVDDLETTDEDVPVTFDLIGNDTDVDGDDLTIGTVSVPPEQGTVVDNGDGTVTFTPAPNFNGPATITYTVIDGQGGEDEGQAVVSVGAVNDGPVANEDNDSTDEDTPITVDLLANDTDEDGDDLTVISATVPADQGTLVDNGDGTVTFTPAPDFNGTATISYEISDGNGGTDTSTHTIEVNAVEDTPEAEDDTAETDEDTPVTIDVLANDSDPDGDPLTVSEATSPDGDVTINPDGTITFTPDENFNGDTTITYTVTDPDGNEDTATVNVTVAPVNDDPVAVDDVEDTDEDTPVVIDLIGNDTDVDGDTVTIDSIEQPANGTVTDNGDGTVTYTPDPDFNGVDTFTYTVTDGNGGTDTATVTVNVGSVNDGPDAVDDEASTNNLTPVIIPVLANDTDPENDPLRVTEASVDEGTVTINPDGTLEYTPEPDFGGVATITYTITDDNGGFDTATVTVSVNDGIVEGTAGDDLIDVNYTDDPEGDMVDNGDEFLPGEGPEDDIILAGDGNDTVNAGEGDDEVYGEDGDDTLNGEAGDDYLSGGEGDDVIFGGDGDDTLDAGQGNDQLFGEDGDDLLLGGPGSDLLDGGAGDDTLIGANNDDEIIGGTGDDTIEGNDGDDVIRGNQGEDVIDGGAGDDTIGGGNDNDTIDGGEGDDTIQAGDGDDTVTGGLGNDDIQGNDGNDTIFGNEGDDVLWGGAGDDTIDGGDGNDNVMGGSGDDTVDLGDGDDIAQTGSGDDTVLGGAGNDTIETNDGNDTVEGGDGDDVINTSGHAPLPDLGYPGLFPSDPNPNDDIDFVDGGDGDDTIITGDDNDTIIGGAGNDTIDGGLDQDTIDGGDGDDRIVGGEGSDTIDGGAGDDTIYAGIDPDLGLPDNLDIPDVDGDLVPDNGQDVVNGGDGNDTIYGADDDDVLNGDAGDDFIDGGVDDDTIDGGTGNDTLIGGQGADTISGGDDRDTIIVDNAEDAIGDVVDGGSGSTAAGDVDDFDVLDLTGAGPLRIVGETTDADGNSTSGTVEFLDGVGGAVIGTLEFTEIESIVPCFTPGTSIATPRGEMLVEDLMVGDKVITRDNGIQEIRWIGAKRMDGRELQNNPHLQPVLIQKGSLGNGLPERDMLVSPNHRMLVNNDRVSLYFDENEVLVSAKHLVNPTEGVQTIASMGTTYIHFMFDNHEVVLSNGAWTESFQPGDYSLKGIGNSQRNEIFELFPELQGEAGREAYASARLTLKKHEAKLLFK